MFFQGFWVAKPSQESPRRLQERAPRRPELASRGAQRPARAPETPPLVCHGFSGGFSGSLWVLLGLSWSLSGLSWNSHGVSGGCPGPLLGLSWAVLGLSWGVLGLSWDCLGLSLGCLGAVMDLPRASWSLLGLHGASWSFQDKGKLNAKLKAS